jgi:hypothetical protein
LGAILVLLEALGKSDIIEFVSKFRTKVWKILIFEWILLLEIETNCKSWVWKEKSVEPSMSSHLGQQHELLYFK